LSVADAATLDGRVRANVVGTGVRRTRIGVSALSVADAATLDGRVRTSTVGTNVRRARIGVSALTVAGAAGNDDLAVGAAGTRSRRITFLGARFTAVATDSSTVVVVTVGAASRADAIAIAAGGCHTAAINRQR
jgi:hypothetical protein